jgi:protein-glucosylgalactosylhydroxylysine glucosidase
MGWLFGLPGLNLGPGEPQTWCERAVMLPRGWDAIEVERLWVRGCPRGCSRGMATGARLEIHDE